MKKQKTKISVLMSVYNGEKYLKEAIESILNQTFKNFEFIIINDGSTDRTKRIIHSFQDDRIKYIENEKNIGLTKSLNIGIKEAKGEYLARMDADDVSLNVRLKTQYNFLENNKDIGILGSAMLIIDSNGQVVGKSKKPDKHYLIKWRCFFGYPMAHPTIMGRMDIFKENLYNEMFISSQDTELWSRLIFEKNIIFANTNQYLHKYRVHIKSVSTKKPVEQKKKSIKVAIKNINQYIKLSEKEISLLSRFFLKEYKFFDINFIYNIYERLINSYAKKDQLDSGQVKYVKRKTRERYLNSYKEYFKKVLKYFFHFKK